MQEVQALPELPLISLVMPTYKTDPKYLREAIDSVLAQHYPAWELCIVDDGSGDPAIGRTVEHRAGADDRVKFRPLERNQGISAASNVGLEMCSGEFVGFLDHDDTLTEDALLRFAQELAAHPDADVVYSDQDKLNLHGRRADPFLKPDWSPVYALGAMYIGHLLVVRRSLAEAVGGFDSEFDSIQDFEFMLRISERTERIRHIPRILYHWRAIPGSIAAGAEEKSGVPELQAQAVSAHLERLGVAAKAIPHAAIPHRAVLAPRDADRRAAAAVSIVIAHRSDGIARLLDSLVERLTDVDAEIVVVRGPWSPADAPPPGHSIVTVTDSTAPFRRGRANNLGAAQATGEYLLFLSDTLEVVESDWIEQLLLHCRLPDVGAVGPLLVRPDGRVDQAGIAIGLRDPALPMMPGFAADSDGYYGSLPCAREVSGISASCMLIRRDRFQQVGGFNEFYDLQYEDLDLCQRLYAMNLSVVFTPRPRLVDHESPGSRRATTDIVDRALFVDCWYDRLLDGDPYFNRGFGRDRADFVPTGWRERAFRISSPFGGLAR
jgi:O-antigen biosynthesis protein